MKTVSIIIPIHNSEVYLDKCVDSCLGQTLDNIEIILVDDASTDGSREKIAEYAIKYPKQIKAIYLEHNIRQGGARNRGLLEAQGKYIAFVDSDDWIDPDFCADLYEEAKLSSAEMAGGKQIIIEYERDRMVQALNYHSADLMNKGQLRHYMTHCGYFFNRIYLRSWLLENNLFFPEGLAFEDSYFNTMTALYAKSVVVTEKGGYHYFQRENSTSRNRNRSHLYDKIRIAEKVWEDAKARRIYEAYRDEIDIKCVSTLASTLFHVCLGSFDKADPAQLKRIKDILKKHGAGYRKNPYYTELDLTQRWFLNINMVSSWLVVLAYRMGAQRWIGTGEAVIQKLKRK